MQTRHTSTREREANRGHSPEGIFLQAVALTPTRSAHPVMEDALRLLAVWAVRAARGQTAGPDSDLTASPPRAMNTPLTQQMEKTPCQ